MMAAVSLLTGACTLREEDQFLDYTIEVEDEQFRVHKVIIASVSDYFKVMLTGSLAESQSDRVRLHELGSLVVSNMIEFTYTGQFGSNTASTEELLACAVYLQMPAAIEECTQLLVSKVNKLNCFDVLANFKTYSVGDGVEEITQFIKSNISDLMRICPPELSYNGFQCYIEFWQKSEWELFVCVLEWVQIHEIHEQHLNGLLSRVRFALMTTEQLEAVKRSDVYTESIGAWQELVHKAEEFHNLPTHHKVLDESEQSRVRSHPVPICYIVSETSNVFYSLHNGKSWKKHEAHIAPTLCEGLGTNVTVNNYLIVCDSHTDEDCDPLIQTWHIFNPRNSAWSTMASLNVARDSFAVVHHKKHLYALGGCTDYDMQVNTLTDVIEKYDFETNNWEVLPTRLPVHLELPDLCVIGDFVYVVGCFSKRLDCLDLSTNTWQSRAPLPIVWFKIDGGVCSPLEGIQVMKLWGEEVLFIFEHTYVMHYYSPAADQWSKWDCFSHVVSEMVHEFCPYVIADQNTLFLHSFAYSMKQSSTDSSLKQSITGKYRRLSGLGEYIGCVKWTVGQKGEKITEVKLDDFPVDIEGDIELPGNTFFTALLSIPPLHLRRPKKISTGWRPPKE